MITISAFQWAPDFAQGQVRDLRVRWALEEAGIPYQTRLLALGDQDKPEYRALQPFGQVPIFEENGFVLFESGAIVLHIGERSETLLPKDPAARARAMQWLIAALNSIEPWVMQVAASPSASAGMCAGSQSINRSMAGTGRSRVAWYCWDQRRTRRLK